jgi:hypothetical protein
MRKMPITANYVAGYLEHRGCFTMSHYSKALGFRLISIKNPEHDTAVFNFLHSNYGINYKLYTQNAFTVSGARNMVKLLEFMRQYCLRHDYLVGDKYKAAKRHYLKYNKTLFKALSYDKARLMQEAREQQDNYDSSNDVIIPAALPSSPEA